MTRRTAAATLADFAVSSPAAAIPSRVRRRAVLHFLDTVGCGLAAVGARASDHATAIAEAQGGVPESSVLGVTRRQPAPVAALANGIRCHALDFDDTHEAGICHASAVVAPAALAVGEATMRGSGEILDAYVVGTEVALRVARAGAGGLYERGFHPTGVCGAFGAAAASARLAGLDPVQATSALGIVGSFASGLLEYLSDGSETKPLHAGWAAQAGVQAARLAQAGATGPASVIEGRFGLLASHTSAAAADVIAEDLGERWELEQISVKAYPACHFGHSSTWLAGDLARTQNLTAADIAEIIVSVPAEGEPLVIAPLELKQTPRTPYEAKFSLPFSVAHVLVHGRLDVASFSPESVGDRDVLALARRVRGEPLRKPSPSRFAGGTRVVCRDGTELERFLDHVPGSPANPFADEQVVDKFRANAGLALDGAAVDDLVESLLRFDVAAGLDRVGAAIRDARPRATS